MSTVVMGILNVTPDSFSDGNKFIDSERACSHALEMIKQGADIIDIGGESTRPGSDPVSEETELNRVIPVIEMIRNHSEIPISIDTNKSVVAEKAINAGADIVNDISALTFDLRMTSVVARSNAPVILMHIKGTPKNMQENPGYTDIVSEIIQYFQDRIEYSITQGISKENIILDPGIGFGKSVEDNFTILKNIYEFRKLGYPILVGPSRKSFIGATLNRNVDDRLLGTAAAVSASIMNGADIIRVHDVDEMSQISIISDKISKYKEGN